MTKIACKYCQGKGGHLLASTVEFCQKCQGYGYILIAERREPKPAHNRPHGSYPRHLKFD